MSAAIGSLLAGIFTTASATTALGSGGFIVVAGLFVIAALCLVWLIVLFINPEEKAISESPAQVPPANKTDLVPQKNNSARQAAPPPHYNDAPPPQTRPVSPPPYNDTPPQPKVRSGQSNIISSPQLPPEESEPSPDRYVVAPSREKSPIPIPVAAETATKPRGPLNILPTETPILPPLFENDDLYKLPRTGERFFFSVKSNDVLENYEDASSISGDNARFALSDGVSASKFVRPWARLLTSHWVANPLLTDNIEAVENWLQAPRKRWQKWVKQTWLPKINERNRSLDRPEFSVAEVTQYIAQGANATFLGVALDSASMKWYALAVGDTCLFHLYQESHGTWDYISFPLKTVDDFTDTPASITSSENATSYIAPTIRLKNNTYQKGDILLLATDALAEWLFKQLDQQRIGDIMYLLNTLNNEMFAKFVDHERTQRRLKDDDTSLIIVRL